MLYIFLLIIQPYWGRLRIHETQKTSQHSWTGSDKNIFIVLLNTMSSFPHCYKFVDTTPVMIYNLYFTVASMMYLQMQLVPMSCYIRFLRRCPFKKKREQLIHYRKIFLEGGMWTTCTCKFGFNTIRFTLHSWVRFPLLFLFLNTHNLSNLFQQSFFLLPSLSALFGTLREYRYTRT